MKVRITPLSLAAFIAVSLALQACAQTSVTTSDQAAHHVEKFGLSTGKTGKENADLLMQAVQQLSGSGTTLIFGQGRYEIGQVFLTTNGEEYGPGVSDLTFQIQPNSTIVKAKGANYLFRAKPNGQPPLQRITWTGGGKIDGGGYQGLPPWVWRLENDIATHPGEAIVFENLTLERIGGHMEIGNTHGAVYRNLRLTDHQWGYLWISAETGGEAIKGCKMEGIDMRNYAQFAVGGQTQVGGLAFEGPIVGAVFKNIHLEGMRYLPKTVEKKAYGLHCETGEEANLTASNCYVGQIDDVAYKFSGTNTRLIECVAIDCDRDYLFGDAEPPEKIKEFSFSMDRCHSKNTGRWAVNIYPAENGPRTYELSITDSIFENVASVQNRSLQIAIDLSAGANPRSGKPGEHRLKADLRNVQVSIPETQRVGSKARSAIYVGPTTHPKGHTVNIDGFNFIMEKNGNVGQFFDLDENSTIQDFHAATKTGKTGEGIAFNGVHTAFAAKVTNMSIEVNDGPALALAGKLGNFQFRDSLFQSNKSLVISPGAELVGKPVFDSCKLPGGATGEDWNRHQITFTDCVGLP